MLILGLSVLFAVVVVTLVVRKMLAPAPTNDALTTSSLSDLEREASTALSNGELAAARDLYTRAGRFGRAAQIAAREGKHEMAASLFERDGQLDRAATSYRKANQEDKARMVEQRLRPVDASKPSLPAPAEANLALHDILASKPPRGPGVPEPVAVAAESEPFGRVSPEPRSSSEPLPDFLAGIGRDLGREAALLAELPPQDAFAAWHGPHDYQPSASFAPAAPILALPEAPSATAASALAARAPETPAAAASTAREFVSEPRTRQAPTPARELEQMLGPSPTADLGNIEIFYRLALAYIAEDDLERARSCLLTVEEVSPEYRDVTEHLARVSETLFGFNYDAAPRVPLRTPPQGRPIAREGKRPRAVIEETVIGRRRRHSQR